MSTARPSPATSARARRTTTASAGAAREPFTHAYHNQPRCDGPGNYGRTSVNRFHILDRIPFTTSFKFDMELWHWKDCKVNMAVLAYYYGLPGAEDTFPPIAPDKLVLRPVPEIAVLHVPGAIEGEKMRILKSTGTAGPQDWDDDSGGQHLWWHGGQKPGDELLLEFNAPKAGKYQVFGRFLKAIDYGIMQLAVNGKKAGKPIDFFHDGVIHTAEIPLGTFELRQGPNRAFRRGGRGESEGPEAIYVRAGLYSDQAA